MYQIDYDPVWQAFWELWQMLLVVFWLVLLSACLIYIPLKSWSIKGGRKAASCLSWLLHSGSQKHYLCIRQRDYTCRKRQWPCASEDISDCRREYACGHNREVTAGHRWKVVAQRQWKDFSEGPGSVWDSCHAGGHGRATGLRTRPKKKVCPEEPE